MNTVRDHKKTLLLGVDSVMISVASSGVAKAQRGNDTITLPTREKPHHGAARVLFTKHRPQTALLKRHLHAPLASRTQPSHSSRTLCSSKQARRRPQQRHTVSKTAWSATAGPHRHERTVTDQKRTRAKSIGAVHAAFRDCAMVLRGLAPPANQTHSLMRL
jgi:hypothetical protein